jgi:hypothetical protein
MAKQQLPPVPPAGRSNKGPGEGERAKPMAEAEDAHAAEQGDAAGRQKNIAVNTTHSGHQQDR